MDLVDRSQDLVIIGLAIRTRPSDAATDIPRFWQEFQAAPRPASADPAIYAVYCDYESDWRGAYTMVLGVAVDPSASVLAGHRRVRIPAGRYARFPADGDPTTVIWKTWMHINTEWNRDRRYIADFERYAGDTAIFVGVA